MSHSPLGFKLLINLPYNKNISGIGQLEIDLYKKL